MSETEFDFSLQFAAGYIELDFDDDVKAEIDSRASLEKLALSYATLCVVHFGEK